MSTAAIASAAKRYHVAEADHTEARQEQEASRRIVRMPGSGRQWRAPRSWKRLSGPVNPNLGSSAKKFTAMVCWPL